MLESASRRTQVYSRPQHAATYDCVTTCFFLDTAHNIIEYLQVIHHVLKVCAVCKLQPVNANYLGRQRQL